MTNLNVVLVSDTHLSPEGRDAEAHWEAVLCHVEAEAPDAVIHLGDLTDSGAHEPDDLDYGRRQLDRLPVRWHAVPGNHDVGDNPWPGSPPGITVSAERRQRWLEAIGPDNWSLTVDGWTLLGLNAQLFESDLAAEEQQWSWLREQVSGCDENQAIALFSHKPFITAEAELESSPVYRFAPRSAWRRLRDLCTDRRLALVLSGHVHQYRQLRMDDVDHLWVPTAWSVLPDETQPVLGAKRCGIMTLEVADGTAPRHAMVEPDGLRQLTLPAHAPG
ncbi:MAG: metallophosphoesterase [Nocardiopsaceae bacterium]|nr:metallophosphoesterase [Nocardiopsaceae bacterium]